MDAEIMTLLATLVELLFYVLLLVFTVHTVFLGYHWFSYGTNRQISLIALATYLSGGAVLFFIIALSLRLL